MTIKQFFLILMARRKLAASIFLCVIALAVVVTLVMPSQYMGVATVVVDYKTDPVAGVVYAAQMQTGYIATQVDIIGSDRVAQRAVKILKLDKDPQVIADWKEATGGQGDIVVYLGSILLGHLTVTPSRESSVIEIGVTRPDRKSAAVYANAYAQAYIDTSIDLKTEPARQYAAWFDERSNAIRADLQEKQRKLAEYEAQTGIIATDAGRLDIENARLAELNSQLVTIQALRQDSQSRSTQALSGNDSVPEVLQSQVIANLKSDLSRAEAKQREIATNYGKNHPDYQETAAEVAGLKERIAQESARIAASLGNTAQINARRENDTRAAIEAQKKRIYDLSQHHDMASVLANDVATSQRNLDAVSQRLAQSSLESQTQQTNITLLTPAIEPFKRSSPHLTINLLIGGLLGGMLAFGTVLFCEIRDRRIRDDAELMPLLGVPLLGKIPVMKPEPRALRAPAPMFARAEPNVI